MKLKFQLHCICIRRNRLESDQIQWELDLDVLLIGN
jgi:hypothetical protein